MDRSSIIQSFAGFSAISPQAILSRWAVVSVLKWDSHILGSQLAYQTPSSWHCRRSCSERGLRRLAVDIIGQYESWTNHCHLTGRHWNDCYALPL